MFERQLTRIDTVQQYVDKMLKACEDSEEARCGYIHLYGVGQACTLNLKTDSDKIKTIRIGIWREE